MEHERWTGEGAAKEARYLERGGTDLSFSKSISGKTPASSDLPCPHVAHSLPGG